MQAVTFNNGIEVVNCTPYDIIFLDDGKEVRVPVSGIVIYADKIVRSAGSIYVDDTCVGNKIKQEYVGSEEGWDSISMIHNEHPGALIIGTTRAAEAYPGKVVVAVPLKGYDKSRPEDKRMNPREYMVY